MAQTEDRLNRGRTIIADIVDESGFCYKREQSAQIIERRGG
jgi:hypothetical protein